MLTFIKKSLARWGEMGIIAPLSRFFPTGAGREYKADVAQW